MFVGLYTLHLKSKYSNTLDESRARSRFLFKKLARLVESLRYFFKPIAEIRKLESSRGSERDFLFP